MRGSNGFALLCHCDWRELSTIQRMKQTFQHTSRSLKGCELLSDLSEWIHSKRIQYLEDPNVNLYLEGWIAGV